MPDLIREPEWGSAGGARVLIEADDWSARQAMTQVLERAGFRPIACAGPGGADTRCAFAGRGGCPAAEQADVIVHALRPADHRNREVLVVLRRDLPGTPVIVEAPEPVLRSRPQDYDGCVVIPAPMSPEGLVEAVRSATT